MTSPKTYRELKEFINQVDEQFLDLPFIVMGEEYGTSIHAFEIATEKTIMFSDGEHQNIVLQKSEFEIFENDTEADGFEIKHIYPEGFPMVFDNSIE